MIGVQRGRGRKTASVFGGVGMEVPAQIDRFAPDSANSVMIYPHSRASFSRWGKMFGHAASSSGLQRTVPSQEQKYSGWRGLSGSNLLCAMAILLLSQKMLGCGVYRFCPICPL